MGCRRRRETSRPISRKPAQKSLGHIPVGGHRGGVARGRAALDYPGIGARGVREAAIRAQACSSATISGIRRVRRGLEEDRAQALLGVGHAELDLLGAGAAALGVRMNHAAAVGQEVRYVQDPGFGEHASCLVGGELIVGAAAQDPAAELSGYVLVNQATDRARREHVELEPEQLAGALGQLGTLGAGTLRGGRIRIESDDLGTGAEQRTDEYPADLTDADHADRAADQALVAIERQKRRFDRAEHRPRSLGRRIAAHATVPLRPTT